MALYVAAKFSQEEMPKIFDPGAFQDLKPQDFVVVPRGDSEDIAFVSALEHKSIHQLKLRRDPYPRVLRRASTVEVESWWKRKGMERQAFIVGKEKARELKLDIKISHVRIDPKDNKAIFHFTSDQRIDFRALVKELNALLKLRIELWQIGVRDEARMVDGFGMCGLQTCCSTWLTEFRPITIKMAKDQDINLPPNKLSGQCGRLLCCLSYEVDQYREMAKAALPKGATITIEGKEMVIVDRNLVGGSYLMSDGAGTMKNIKAEQLAGLEVRIPDQLKRFGKKFTLPAAEPAPPAEPKEGATTTDARESTSPQESKPPQEPRPGRDSRRGRDRDRDRGRRDRGDVRPQAAGDAQQPRQQGQGRPEGQRQGKPRPQMDRFRRGLARHEGDTGSAPASGPEGAPPPDASAPGAQGPDGTRPPGRKKKHRRRH